MFDELKNRYYSKKASSTIGKLYERGTFDDKDRCFSLFVIVLYYNNQVSNEKDVARVISGIYNDKRSKGVDTDIHDTLAVKVVSDEKHRKRICDFCYDYFGGYWALD